MLTIGFVINPLAGIGGSVALKGSDGADTVEQALAKGGAFKAQQRASVALEKNISVKKQIQFVCFDGVMGAALLSQLDFNFKVIGKAAKLQTDSIDTVNAIHAFVAHGVDLILFVGGDGTARDIHSAIDQATPVLGIPSGVKMHSGVFALSPNTAGEIIRLLVVGDMVSVSSQEVRDIDEEAYRQERVISRYFGEMIVPDMPRFLQATKTSGVEVEELVVAEIAADLVNNIEDNVLYLVGAGTTAASFMNELGLPNSLLGIDVVKAGHLLRSDATEQNLLQQIQLHNGETKLIISVTGGQGFLFGRGNQQLSPAVIRAVGIDNLIILATKTKLRAFDGRPLLVDTGDRDLDTELEGLYQVVTGYHDRVLYSVAAA
ncbi:MAG: putative polyphosphate/ATP-dependent NAD kinase [Pseudomonadales bacterium]